jgi:type VI secretion system secreted protein VgrG
MAQPYSGPGYGSHHPLHKGTEVLIAHIDGDPDRPIIVGSVPNPHTPSPSTSANATQSVIQTASGIRIEMEDLQT